MALLANQISRRFGCDVGGNPDGMLGEHIIWLAKAEMQLGQCKIMNAISLSMCCVK